MAEMVRRVAWPFPCHRFPSELGAVVQRTVLDGDRPALLVYHSTEGDWAIGDGLDDPNEPGASIATHIWHAIERNRSISALADLPPGHEATRRWPGDPWVVEPVEAVE
jgi:hypothetical protein